MLLVELWLSFLYASYNGAMVVALTEIVPASVRTAGFSLAYSLATALGGFTPYISTFVSHPTDLNHVKWLAPRFATLPAGFATLCFCSGPS
jgi:MFS transporter, MHS family, citrate/tricarballylate:H+ symporter